jgi:RHS repeat-associated protein
VPPSAAPASRCAAFPASPASPGPPGARPAVTLGTRTWAYEATTSRLALTVDALGQVTLYSYGVDNLLSGVSYTGAVYATPSVAFTYDAYYKRLTSMTDGTGTTLATTLSYLPNSGDRRLAGIASVGLSAGQSSSFTYTSNDVGWITASTETSDAPTVYPSSAQQIGVINPLNQVSVRNGQNLTYDADGHLLSDGQRSYSWDAAGRLIGVSYPGQPGKSTSFTYDGLGRRVVIANTAGGSTTTLDYVWCGQAMCQARNLGGTVAREYLAEGEYLPGSPATAEYYAPDPVGTVRRVFTSSSAAAYAYDPYGQALQATAPTTDFTYAGMFHEAGSGLDLTLARAYDPQAGRWLTRDPLGEATDPYGNLYAYVQGNPVTFTDPLGLVAGKISNPSNCLPGPSPATLINAVTPQPPDPIDQMLQQQNNPQPTILGIPMTPNMYSGTAGVGLAGTIAGAIYGAQLGGEAGAEFGAEAGLPIAGPLGFVGGGVVGGAVGAIGGAFVGVLGGMGADQLLGR